VRNTLAGLFRPGVDESARASASALAGLRILVGLLWLYNVSWKRPPDFGESAGNGLYGFTTDAVEHPVFPPYSWVVEHVVLPNFTAFGWMVLVVESMLAVLLLTGTLVRFAALVGIAQSLAIGLSVAQTPGEWPWSYWMMIGIHVVLLLTACGRAAAVDRMRAEATAGRGRDAAVRLLRGWGIVVVLTGIVALVLAVGEDPIASTGTSLGGPDLSVSLGSYNLLGAATLLVVAGLMLAAASLRRRALALAATAVAALAAASVYAQVGRADVWLGGSNTSAAYLLCAAVVSGVSAAVLARPDSAPAQAPTRAPMRE
jgi:hypothetical protein